MNISYSRASCYASCPQEHWWRYIRKIKPKTPSRPLTFGTDFHKLLELRGSPEALREAKTLIADTYYELPSEAQIKLGENYIEDLSQIFDDYQRVYQNEDKPDVTESRFEIPLAKYKGEPVNFVGIIDELYGDGEAIGEHKTFTKAPSLDALIMNTQVSLYAKACENLFGKLPSYVRWDYIHSSPASEPIWLEKSQRFSEASNSKITPYSWERACKRMNITDESTLNKAENYAKNIPNFFFRHNLEINKDMTETIWNDFKALSKDIVINGQNNKRKRVTRDCSWCSYRPLCYGEFTGADLDYIIQKDFTEG